MRPDTDPNTQQSSQTGAASGCQSTVFILFASHSIGWESRLVRRLTGQPIHAAIIIDGVAISVSRRSTGIYAALDFVAHYPGLTEVFAVPTPRPPDLLRYAQSVDRRWMVLRTLLNWITYGAVPPPEHCVASVIRGLVSGGVAVPRRVTTPRKLRDWLAHQGFERGHFA